jgi:photosystem II stability/assembly factor-like uncharacterized protein
LLKPTSYLRHSIIALVFLAPVSPTIAQSVSPELLNGLQWRLIGPFRGGRVAAVAGVPGDSTTFYFGAVDGGIWKTTDAGVVWLPIFDKQPIASVGALAVAPSDPKIIYAGTGESDIRSDLSSGNGVYKSSDGGQTWIHLGLENTRQISRIVVDPEDSTVVYVGALGHAYGPNPERGAYKSVDGGMHWTKVLDQGPEIGIADLAICSSNPSLLFASTWQTHRPPWSTYAPIDGSGGGMYRSQDGGRTWKRLEGKGLPEGDWGRVGIDVASNGERVYALIQAKKAGLYRSDDGGNTWRLENSDSRLTSRAWYFSSITVDPRNPNVLYIPNVSLYRSEDGGKTISIVRGAPGGDDYHQIWIDPKNSSNMVLGTDQGTTISLDGGKTWNSWYNQPTAQLYHVITDSRFPYAVYGAQQDSGGVAVLSRTDYGQITSRNWFPAGASESGYIAVDPNDPDIIYLSGVYGSVARYNRRTGLSQDVTPWPVSIYDTEINQRKYRAPWSPVLVFSPADSKALYLGTQYVMKTIDGGLHWLAISPDLTGSSGSLGNAVAEGPPTIENAKQRGYGIVSTIAPSPLNRDLIWAGSDTGLIYLTRDGGQSWNNITPQGLSDWSEISLIEPSHSDPAVAYAAVDRSRLEDQTPYIYRTRDYGSSWQRITSGMPVTAFLRAVREDSDTRGLLFAGTELGVFVSFDDGDHWQPLQLNLPVTSVRDLTIHGDDLVIATHGRSFWILDNIMPLRQASEAAKAGSAWLFRPASAIRVDNDTFVGTPLPPEEPTAENPPSGAMIDYYLNSPAKKVTLEILDAENNVVRKFSSEDQLPGKRSPVLVAERWVPKRGTLAKTPGMHRFVWDLRWNDSSGPGTDDDAALPNPSSPKVPPGKYQVRLIVDGQSSTQSLDIVMDPRSPATSEILAQQFQMAKQIFTQTRDTRHALAEIGLLRKQIADLEQEPAAQEAEFKAALFEAQSDLGKILENKETAEKRSGLLNAYKSLLSALLVVEAGDRQVPTQATAVYEESSQQVRACIGEWTAFKQKQLPHLNRQLVRAHLPGIVLGKAE